MSEEMTIEERAGVPYCTEEKCVSYDGKRCALLGHAPEKVCVPYVRLMAQTLADAGGVVRVLRAERDIIRTLCSRAELMSGGRVAARDVIAVLDTGEGKQVIQ